MYKHCSPKSLYPTYIHFVKISSTHAIMANRNSIMLVVAAGVQWANGRVNGSTFVTPATTLPQCVLCYS